MPESTLTSQMKWGVVILVEVRSLAVTEGVISLVTSDTVKDLELTKVEAVKVIN